jgi:hypothetical protein
MGTSMGTVMAVWVAATIAVEINTTDTRMMLPTLSVQAKPQLH